MMKSVNLIGAECRTRAVVACRRLSGLAPASFAMDEPIYHHPKLYDLEHGRPEPDIEFYVRLAQEWRPARLLELGCGTGRITLPLASAPHKSNLSITALDLSAEMLQAARRKSSETGAPTAANLNWIEADLRTWRSPERYDLILSPCGTLCHLLALEDQLTAWRTAYLNLNAGGRFVADVSMPNLPAFAESMQNPPRALLEWDRDTSGSDDDGDDRRLIRCKALLYDAASQQASVRFFYDKIREQEEPERFLSDYERHVYFPRELELLFRSSGFLIESVWGDYSRGALRNDSRNLIMVGVKPGSARNV